MRISDWSSDVCSSDLVGPAGTAGTGQGVQGHPVSGVLENQAALFDPVYLFRAEGGHHAVGRGGRGRRIRGGRSRTGIPDNDGYRVFKDIAGLRRHGDIVISGGRAVSACVLRGNIALPLGGNRGKRKI